MNPVLIAAIAGAAVLLLSSFSSGPSQPTTTNTNTDPSGFDFEGLAGTLGNQIAAGPVGTDWEDLKIAPGGNALYRYVSPGKYLAGSILFGPLGAIPSLIGARNRQKEAKRVEKVLSQMKAGNWFKVRLNPDGTVTGFGDFSGKTGPQYVGIQNVLNGETTAKVLPPMINKVGRYISRESNACSGARGGALRACKRYYVAARIVKKFLEDQLDEVKP